MTVPPHKRVGSDDREELSPVDHPGERHECDSGSIIQPAWPDVPLDVEGQLLAKEEILGCEPGVR